MTLDGIYTRFEGEMSYGDYLGLDTLLSAQKPLSSEHDELLFIVIHQAKELWMKLLNHELDAAISNVRAGELQPAFKCLARVGRIQEQMIQAWSVLATMTPADYLKFRPYLGKSSGFQSWQYRMIEFKLGAKNAKMIEPHRHRPDIAARLQAALETPSLYDETLHLLSRRGHTVPAEILNRDVTKPYVASPAIEAIWLKVYRQSEKYFDLYELAEELVDLEDSFQQWRFRHMKTVERIIGMKKGTGGSSGVGYLKQVLENSFFPELWSVRTEI